jgi:hypothetical protein
MWLSREPDTACSQGKTVMNFDLHNFQNFSKFQFDLSPPK